MTKKDRRIYWLAAVLLAVYALIGWMRFQQALAYWYYFLELGVWPHPIYLTLSGGMIGIGYSSALIFHLFRFRFTRLLIRLLGIALIVWLWVDRIFIAIRETFISLLPVTLLITAVTISMDIFVVSKLTYKQKKENHASEN